MSVPCEKDGGQVLDRVLLGLVVSQWHHFLVFGLYMVDLGEDMIDHEQYIHARIEATIPC